MERDAIFCNVSEPMPTRKSKRMFKLTRTDLDNTESIEKRMKSFRCALYPYNEFFFQF